MDELQLTKKAEAYVAKVEDVNFANSLLTLQIDRTSRKALSLSITALIDLLDDLDPDPDLEDDDIEDIDEREPDNDTEPNGDERDASYTHAGAMGGHWCEDVEEENEHGGDILDQPHDPEEGEPWLGWGNTMGQPGVDVESVKDVEDSPDYGGAGNFTGTGQEQARKMLRGRGRKERSLTIVGPVTAIANWHGIPPTDPVAMDARAHYWAAKGF